MRLPVVRGFADADSGSMATPTTGKLAAALFILCVLVSGSVSAQELPLRIVGADATLEEDTRRILYTAHTELVHSTHVAIADTVTVVYVSRAQSFDSVVGGRFPDWGIAAAVGEKRLIAVRSPLEFPLGRSLRETLRHELAHLHLDYLCNLRQVPRWMHEGYAQQFAHEWVFGDDFFIARAVLTDDLISLRDIDGVNSFAGSKAQLAYTEAYLSMGHFLAAYGWDGLLLFCEAIRNRENWDAAFRAATGDDYAAYNREFQAAMRSRYNWIAFLGDTALIWIGLAVAFVVLYIIKRRRTARLRREWERNEAIEDVLYSPFGQKPPDLPSPPGVGDPGP